MSDNNYPFKGPGCNAHPLKGDLPSVPITPRQSKRSPWLWLQHRLWEGESVFYIYRERERSWISDGGGSIGGWRDRMQQRRERQMGWWGESETERYSLGAESLGRKMIGSEEMGGIQSVRVWLWRERVNSSLSAQVSKQPLQLWNKATHTHALLSVRPGSVTCGGLDARRRSEEERKKRGNRHTKLKETRKRTGFRQQLHSFCCLHTLFLFRPAQSKSFFFITEIILEAVSAGHSTENR